MLLLMLVLMMLQLLEFFNDVELPILISLTEYSWLFLHAAHF